MLVILSGASGAGKDTIKRRLMKRNSQIVTLPSFTDRPKRNGDIDGESYYFVDTKEFKRMIKDGELYEHNVHHNHYYGTSKKLLNYRIQQGNIIVKDIDVNGTENLVKLLENDVKVVTIFLRVPKEELRRRLEHRQDKPSKEEIELRLSRFDYEESKMGSYDYVIKNDDVEKTTRIVMNIIKNEYKLNKKAEQ